MEEVKILSAEEARRQRVIKESRCCKRMKKKIMRKIIKACKRTDCLQYSTIFGSEADKRSVVLWLENLGYRAFVGAISGVIFVEW